MPKKTKLQFKTDSDSNQVTNHSTDSNQVTNHSTDSRQVEPAKINSPGRSTEDDNEAPPPSTPKKQRMSFADSETREAHGYVIRLYDVTTSPSKVKYFNAVIDNGIQESNIVCYNPDLHEAFSSAKLKDCPIKISKFTVENDQYRNQTKFKLGSAGNAEFSDMNIPYNLVAKKLEWVNAFTDLINVENIALESIINVACHVTLVGEAFDEDTKFGRKKKMNVRIHDNTITESIRLVLWGNHAQKITASGSYRFKELRVKTYNGRYLTTTAYTEITQSNESYEVRLDDNYNSLNQETIVAFPAIGINKLETNYYCSICNHKVIKLGKYGMCNKCPMKALLGEKFFDVKVSFKNGSENVMVTFPHNIFIQLIEKVNADHNDLDDIEEKLLVTKDLSVKYKQMSRIATAIL
uniref:Replication protein A OB domain-containing protein n=2 Tax=Clytia hemisphaerica TaxID=252671 RepID=A0A7M5UEA3_9CNID